MLLNILRNAPDCFLDEAARDLESLSFLRDTVDLAQFVGMPSDERVHPPPGDRQMITIGNMLSDISSSYRTAVCGVLWYPEQYSFLSVIVKYEITSACLGGSRP
jgi:hypothetical protein